MIKGSEADILAVDTTELDRLAAIETEREEIQRFIDWLYDEKGWRIAEYRRNDAGDIRWDALLEEVPMSRERIMADFYDINLARISHEKGNLLRAIRGEEQIPWKE